MRKLTEVTKKDVADAALISQLIGGADLANVSVCCIEIPPRKLHDCPDCEHVEHGEYCDHYEDWDCAAKAIGATTNAVHLWMSFGNALGTPAEERAGELRYLKKNGTKRELTEHALLYAWVDSIHEGGIDHDEHGYIDLEVAALLREGHLPPGWKIVGKHRRSRRRSQNKYGSLPVVQVDMSRLGPVVR